MSRPTRKELVQLQQHRHDPDEWEDKKEPIEVRGRRTAVLSFRLPIVELEELQLRARAAGETVSEYLRKSLSIRFRGTGATMFLTFGGQGPMSVVGSVPGAAWSEAPPVEDQWRRVPTSAESIKAK